MEIQITEYGNVYMSSPTDTDVFVKNYQSFLTTAHPVQMTRKSLQIVLGNSATIL